MNTKIINEALLKEASKEKDFDVASEMILEAFGQEDSSVICVIPNVSKVRDLLKNDFPNFNNYIECGFWIVVEEMPNDLYEVLEALELFPYWGYYLDYNYFMKKAL